MGHLTYISDEKIYEIVEDTIKKTIELKEEIKKDRDDKTLLLKNNNFKYGFFACKIGKIYKRRGYSMEDGHHKKGWEDFKTFTIYGCIGVVILVALMAVFLTERTPG